MTWLVTDNAQSKLATGGAAAGSTTITLDTGGGSLFPSPGTGQAFPVRIGSNAFHENHVCISRSGDVLTLSSGLSSNWPVGTAVMLPFNAAVFADLVQRGELGNASAKNVGTTAGTVAAGDDSRFGELPAKLSAINSLTWASDQLIYLTGTATAALCLLSAFVRGLLGSADAATFRTGLGLGNAATRDVGVANSQVAAGDHQHAVLGSANVCFIRQSASNADLSNLVMAANTAFTFSPSNRITNLLVHADYDPHSDFNTATGTYTVPTTGLYRIDLTVNAHLTNEYGDLNIVKNYTSAIGNPLVLRSVSVSGHSWYSCGIATATSYLNAGDTISFHGSYTTNPAQSITNIRASLSIKQEA